MHLFDLMPDRKCKSDNHRTCHSSDDQQWCHKRIVHTSFNRQRRINGEPGQQAKKRPSRDSDASPAHTRKIRNWLLQIGNLLPELKPVTVLNWECPLTLTQLVCIARRDRKSVV